jgi:ATP-binding cassette subfamily B protein
VQYDLHPPKSYLTELNSAQAKGGLRRVFNNYTEKNLKPTKHIQKTHTRQLDQSDCGVACLQSLVKYYDGNMSLEQLRKLSGTSKQGTSLLGLYQAANKIGFTAQGNEADIQALINHGEPLILHVVIDKRLQHYVVCYGYKEGKFLIGDPAKGLETYSKAELEDIWQSKTCLTLKPNENFKLEKSERKDKYKWFKDVIEKDFRIIGFSLILGIAIAILGMTMAVFSQKLIDDILPSKEIRKLVAGIVLVSFLLLTRVGFEALRGYFLIRQTKDFNNRIIDKFYSSLLHLPKPFFDNRKIGELVARLNDTQRVQRVINKIVGNIAIDALVTLSSLSLILYYSWQSGVIVLLSLPLYAVLIYRFNKPIIKAQKEVMQSYAHNESNYISSMKGIAEIKSNNKQAFFRKLNKLIYGNYQDKAFNLGKINIKLGVFSSLFSTFFLIGILSYGSINVYNDQLQLGELMAILGVAGSLLPSVANLALISIAVNEAKVAYNRMYEFASIEPEEEGQHDLQSFESLTFQNASFRFAGQSELFRDVDFNIKKNRCTVLVGESGSGKSTIGEILQKSYGLANGNILVNDKHQLKDISIESWRKLTAIVPQDINVFSGNLISNVVMSDDVDLKAFENFCNDYGFIHFIQQLPQGVATILGEEGINLSGGQKQMLGLMRALYARPQFLILDEFTSAMDRNTEKMALDLIKSLQKEMAILFITHRLNIVPKIADEIIVLQNKTISQNGSHQILMSTENFYSNYWKELNQLT